MIVEILIAQRQSIDSLRDHLRNRMIHLVLLPAVEKALRKPFQQIELLVGLPQHQTSCVGTDRSPIETGYNFTFPASCKTETRLDTLCHSESRSLLVCKQLRLQMFMTEKAAFA